MSGKIGTTVTSVPHCSLRTLTGEQEELSQHNRMNRGCLLEDHLLSRKQITVCITMEDWGRNTDELLWCQITRLWHVGQQFPCFPAGYLGENGCELQTSGGFQYRNIRHNHIELHKALARFYGIHFSFSFCYFCIDWEQLSPV